MNVYDHLDGETLDELSEHLDAESDVVTFHGWLERRVDDGSIPQIVADHISRWNELKAQTDRYLTEYEEYSARRLGEWEPLGLVRPSGSMFDSTRPALPVLSTKQPRNAPCSCGSGLKHKRCHGAPR